jgi:hypothetical protein
MGWNAPNKTDAVMFFNYYTSGKGWGALYISEEFCNSFEPGDKRKDYSVVTHGQINPYTLEKVGDKLVTGSENMPNNYSLKWWKRATDYAGDIYYAQSLYWMRYSAVLLNYSECLFETIGEGADENGNTGWDYLDMIRDRAWGNLEVTIQPEFPNEPIPLNEVPVVVPDAESFYKNDPHFSSYTADATKVAVMNERRHEFLAEYSFWYDLVRTGMAEEFLDKEYPQNSGVSTNREFTYQSYHTIYPIPSREVTGNALIGPENQNPGY